MDLEFLLRQKADWRTRSRRSCSRPATSSSAARPARRRSIEPASWNAATSSSSAAAITASSAPPISRMAGLKVKVRRAPRASSAARRSPRNSIPGFRNSVAAYTVSLLNPKVIRDLDLREHGLTHRRAPRCTTSCRCRRPLPHARRRAAPSARSRSSAHATPSATAPSTRELDAVADVLRDLVLQAPPNVVEGCAGAQLARAAAAPARLGNRLRRLSTRQLRALLDLFTKSAGDYLDGWFESDPIKALLGFDAVVGNYASPYTPGTAYVLLHHVFGEVNGKKGAWGHAIGGMGAITQAMAQRRRARTASRSRPTRRCARSSSRAAAPPASCSRTGAAIRAARVVAERQSEAALRPHDRRTARSPADFLRAHAALALRLRHVPDERRAVASCRASPPCRAATRPITTPPGIIIAPSLGYMDRAYHDARAHGWSREPIVEMLIPSTLDDTLAPHGRACREPVLPARRAGAAGRPLLGRSSRRGRRPDDRHGRALCAGLQGQRASAARR